MFTISAKAVKLRQLSCPKQNFQCQYKQIYKLEEQKLQKLRPCQSVHFTKSRKFSLAKIRYFTVDKQISTVHVPVLHTWLDTHRSVFLADLNLVVFTQQPIDASDTVLDGGAEKDCTSNLGPEISKISRKVFYMEQMAAMYCYYWLSKFCCNFI